MTVCPFAFLNPICVVFPFDVTFNPLSLKVRELCNHLVFDHSYGGSAWPFGMMRRMALSTQFITQFNGYYPIVSNGHFAPAPNTLLRLALEVS